MKKAVVKKRRRPVLEGFERRSPLAKGFRLAQALRDEEVVPQGLLPSSEDSASGVGEEVVGPLWDHG